MGSTCSHDLYGRNYYQEKTSVRGGSHSAQVLQEDGQREGYQRSVSLPLLSFINSHRTVLRERYLRDDVACGVERCNLCPRTKEELLSSSGDKTHKLYPNGHFILPDTNVFLAQMDLMESNLFTPPIILLQTVIEEVRHRSLPLFNRLKTIIKAEEKRIWVFYNEYRSYVHAFIFLKNLS